MGIEKNFLICLLGIIFFVVETARKINNMRKIKIFAKKSNLEVILSIAVIIIFAKITVLYSKDILHYILGISAIAYILFNMLQQGMFNDGIMIMNKFKEIYKWSELDKVEVKKRDIVEVTYFGKDGFSQTNKFSLDKYKDIIELFIRNGIEYTIKYN